MKRILLILGLALTLSGIIQPAANYPPLPKASALKTAHIRAAVALKTPQVAPSTVSTVTPVSEPVEAPQINTAPASCGDNYYATYIYEHESGCDTTSTNYLGCYGIGQDCNGIVRNRCGADYTCQNEYFTQYAYSRYGSWVAAYNFWVAHRWW